MLKLQPLPSISVQSLAISKFVLQNMKATQPKELEFLHQIASLFTGHANILDIEPLGEGHINDTYLVKAKDNDNLNPFLLQRINHKVFRSPVDVMHNISKVSEHLRGVDYPFEILRPLPKSDGKFFHQDNGGNYWRAFPYFENTRTFQKAENPDIAFAASQAFGHFITALRGLSPMEVKYTIPGFHDGLLRVKQFKEALRQAISSRSKEAKKEISQCLDNVWIFKKVAKLQLPIRILHHDTKINNLLFHAVSSEVFCVIDLDTVMPGIIFSDFGDMVRSMASETLEDDDDYSKAALSLTMYHAIQEGFLQACSQMLQPNERKHLSTAAQWITLIQVLRFLGDYLTGDKYYRIKYPEHNLVRTRNQLALFNSMQSQLKGL